MSLSFWPNLCSKASPLDLASICALCEFVKSHLKQVGYDDFIAKDGAQLALDATPYHTSAHVNTAYVSNRQHEMRRHTKAKASKSASKSAHVSIRQHASESSASGATPYEGSGIESDAVGVAALELVY